MIMSITRRWGFTPLFTNNTCGENEVLTSDGTILLNVLCIFATSGFNIIWEVIQPAKFFLSPMGPKQDAPWDDIH